MILKFHSYWEQIYSLLEFKDFLYFIFSLKGGTFKKRWDKHNSDFRHEKNETATKLSGYIWKLKRANVPFQISWEKITNARTFNPVKRKCNLCLQEKFRIMFQPEGASLNSRKELFSTCRHRTQPLLQNFK